ncbi:MAG: adenine deaminase [Saprospiraceae bacterium]|nr:adenine deaminase [Lewinella sp.]
MQQIQAHYIDLDQRRIFPAEITYNDKILEVRELDTLPDDAGYLLPGFVDAHVHVESSMLPPSEFARLAVVHGTLATVSDPHEIANVLGVAGVEYMLKDARQVPFKFCFGAPSCVPATSFETAGAAMDAAEVITLLQRDDIGYLSEMMNFPGVIHQDAQVMAKIAGAKRLHKPVDGHAPGLRGIDAQTYFAAGITTDHECFTYEEGREKAKTGVKILIREGSAARNFEALWPLIKEFPEQIMFCSDDKHPDDLIKGHINQLVARAVALRCDLFDVLRAACVHPREHYQLPLGQLKPGDPADFIILKDLTQFLVKESWLNGTCVARDGRTLIERRESPVMNHFKAKERKPADFVLPGKETPMKVRIIKTLDGEIVTEEEIEEVSVTNGRLEADTKKDILKIAVINRYTEQAPAAVAFVRGFGLQCGAIASTVAHDSHNIVAVGTDDEALATTVNALIGVKGGVCATDGKGITQLLPLPIAGLMSTEDGYTLAENYARIDNWVKSELSCKLQAPFMALSFLALPVIPALKLTDLGLFDVRKFGFTEVVVRSEE